MQAGPRVTGSTFLHVIGDWFELIVKIIIFYKIEKYTCNHKQNCLFFNIF